MDTLLHWSAAGLAVTLLWITGRTYGPVWESFLRRRFGVEEQS